MNTITTNPTDAQVRAHNQMMVTRAVAMQVWKQTSRMNTSTRNSTWSRS